MYKETTETKVKIKTDDIEVTINKENGRIVKIIGVVKKTLPNDRVSSTRFIYEHGLDDIKKKRDAIERIRKIMNHLSNIKSKLLSEISK